MNSNHQGIMSSAIEYWSTRLCKNIVRLQYFSSPFYLSVIIDSFIMCSLQLHDVIIALWWWSVIGEKLPCCNCNCTKLGKNLYESLTWLLWDPWLTSFLHNSYLYNGGRNIGKSSTSFMMIYGQMVILAPNELLTLKYQVMLLILSLVSSMWCLMLKFNRNNRAIKKSLGLQIPVYKDKPCHNYLLARSRLQKP